MKMGKIAVGSINLPSLLPRDVDENHVRDMKRTLRAGGTLPPMEVDPQGNVLVKGRHRQRTYLEEYGPEYEAEVVFVPYTSEDERLAAAFADNLAHGLKPTKRDEERVMRLLAMRYRWPVSRLSTTFSIPVEDIERRIRPTVATRVHGRRKVTPTYTKPAVRTKIVRAAQAVVILPDSDVMQTNPGASPIRLETDAQQKIIERALGISPWQVVRQVADWGRLPEAFWPDPTPQLLEHLDEAIDFLTAYGERLSEEDEE